MSANKAKNTKPELLLRKALWSANLRGYRLHKRIALKNSPPCLGGVSPQRRRGGSSAKSVRPDITYSSKKVAIFIHGCFWHRCPKCSTSLPKHNTPFWKAKFERNTERDARKVADLTAAGWTVLTFWECDLKADLNAVVKKIKKHLV